MFFVVGLVMGLLAGALLTVWWYEKADEQEWRARGQSR